MLGPALFAAIGIGANLVQYQHTMDVIDENIEREKVAAGFRAQDRRQMLREALAAQRIMAIAQGSDADIGSNIRLRDVSLENFLKDVERDQFQQEGVISSLKNQSISASLRAVTGVGRSLLSYASSTRETLGGTAGTTQDFMMGAPT